MMPDLGKYAVEIGFSYAISIALLVGIVWLSLAQSRRARKALKEAEDRWDNG